MDPFYNIIYTGLPSSGCQFFSPCSVGWSLDTSLYEQCVITWFALFLLRINKIRPSFHYILYSSVSQQATFQGGLKVTDILKLDKIRIKIHNKFCFIFVGLVDFHS